MAPKFTKVDLTPKRHHFYNVLLFILGTLFPPLAVAARFGLGTDFFLNLILTLCGYIPGHAHNFYIQNIRNNKNHARTPKWAQRWGLVDTSSIKRHERRSEWASRYNERLPRSTLEGAPYEEGQERSSSVDVPLDGNGSRRNGRGEYWRPEDEQYYGQRNSSSSSVQTSRSAGRWHYPANFEDTIAAAPPKKKKDKKDRWARTEDAYNMPEEGRKKKKKKKSRSTVGGHDSGSVLTEASGSTADFPEDPEGGLYAPRRPAQAEPPSTNNRTDDRELFTHEF